MRKQQLNAFQKEVDRLCHNLIGLIEEQPELKQYLENKYYGKHNQQIRVLKHGQVFIGNGREEL